MAVGLDPAQHLAGPQHHRGGHAGQPGGFDAVAAAGAAPHHPMQEHQLVAGFLHQHLGIGHVGQQLGQLVELVVVGGEDRAGAEVAGQVFGHRPGDREAIEGGGAAADLIEQHQGALAGVVKDVGGFGHLHHEGGLAAGQVVDGANAGEDPVGDAEAGGAGRDPGADLGQQLQQSRLAQVAALAAGVGPGEHQQVGGWWGGAGGGIGAGR